MIDRFDHFVAIDWSGAKGAKQKGIAVAIADARHEHGLPEAIDRAEEFARLGADILFVEAPRTEAEMRTVCAALPGPKMANIVEGGETPDLPPEHLHDIGYAFAAYPLSLMAAAMRAMVETMGAMKTGGSRADHLMGFGELRKRIGFDAYYEASSAYESSARPHREAAE